MREAQTTENGNAGMKVLGQIAVALVFLALTLAAVKGFLAVFAPKPYEPPLEPFLKYDRQPMQAAVSPERVRQELDGILELGSRAMGQDGHSAARAYVRQRFADAGLDVLEHRHVSVAPMTGRAEIESAAGKPLKVDIYPFMPNHMQPMNTPASGLSGELVLLTEEVLLTQAAFADCIGLIDLSRTKPEGFGWSWTKYAERGIKALILAHPEGLAAIEWDQLKEMASPNPANFVRVAAGPGIFKQEGKRIRLHVRTGYREIPVTNVIGRMTVSDQAPEAVVVVSSYDAGSILPDLAPGVIQAYPLAIQLALIEGLKPYREELKRDIIFISFGGRTMAQDSQNRLLAALGEKTERAARKTALLADREQNAVRLEALEALVPLFAAPAFFVDPDLTIEALSAAGDEPRNIVEEQLQHVLNTLVFEESEKVLVAKIDFERGDQDLEGEAYKQFQAVKRRYDRAFSNAGYGTDKLLRDAAEFAAERTVRARLEARLKALLAYHRQRQTALDGEIRIHDMFAQYRDIVVIAPELAPAAGKPKRESISFTMGRDYQDKTSLLKRFRDHVSTGIQELKLDAELEARIGGKRHGQQVYSKTGGITRESRLWSLFMYPAFSVVNVDRAGTYKKAYFPCELEFMRNTQSLEYSLSVIGEAVLSAAFGNGRFPQPTRRRIHSFRGNVYAANVGQSIIPNYPVQGALVTTKNWTAADGHFPTLVMVCNIYGRYEYPSCAAHFAHAYDYSPDAFAYGPDGYISHIKDEGTAAQSVYKSMHLRAGSAGHDVNLVLYRGVPVTILDLINPQTLKTYSGAAFIRQRGLAAFASTNIFAHGNLITSFLPPDERFFVLLKAGALDNEAVQETRAFMLGTSAADLLELEGLQAEDVHMGREITGRGYLAYDHRILLDIPLESARSMIHINGKRLVVQNQENFQMADERTVAFQERSLALARQAAEPEIAKHKAILRARDSVTYAILNHPVLRSNIFQAILGILWYLGLLVPFVFFFEKLVFGFTDIRKQLSAHLVIFLVVFMLLKLLHPAFTMIRSSLMILLGFLIMLISTGISILFAGKFQENLDSIRRRRGRVKAAEVNRMGVVATAFLLGLNNMHRRRVRTGLTCATLVLMTFVMICFTSTQTDLTDTQIAIGRAAFNGFVVKNERFKAVEGSELFALQTKYGREFDVAPRYIYIGSEDWETRQRFHPQLRVECRDAKEVLHDFSFTSALLFSHEEPLAGRINVLTGNKWFTREQMQATSGAVPVMISAKAAAALRVTPEMVDAGDVRAQLNGEEVLIYGIFDGNSLSAAQDLDGKSLLPFDVTALKTLNREGRHNILADDTDPLLDGSDVVLACAGRWPIEVSQGWKMLNSIAVVFPDDYGYKKSRAAIDQWLEQRGLSTYYGIDGYSFRGKRSRESSATGYADMFIPMLIVALTVLNTMKGSVYERKEEIFVYNAVGIAPIYVFFMFMAEALVYAVVGSVLGYLLSQGTGRVLMILGWTGGMNMTFTSWSTVAVSVAIAVCVFLSSLLPAWTAKKIAQAAEEQGWKLPEPDGDVITFQLPFTLYHHDRIAILSFLERYFVDHGSGGGGPFFAGPPEMRLADDLDELAGNAYIPEMAVTIWLKPFDLGVSQRLTIRITTDPETREYIPIIVFERLSGTRDKWTHLNERFVKLLRRHFLHWRAVGDEDKEEMFAEARGQLEQKYLPATAAAETA